MWEISEYKNYLIDAYSSYLLTVRSINTESHLPRVIVNKVVSCIGLLSLVLANYSKILHKDKKK